MAQVPSRRSPVGDDAGFTLLEVLVALAILGLSLAALFAVFSGSMARTQLRERQMTARALAQSLLTEATNGVPTAPRGIEGIFSWQLAIAPYDAAPKSTAGLAANRVAATVRWQDGERPRSLTLTTLALRPQKATQ